MVPRLIPGPLFNVHVWIRHAAEPPSSLVDVDMARVAHNVDGACLGIEFPWPGQASTGPTHVRHRCPHPALFECAVGEPRAVHNVASHVSIPARAAARTDSFMSRAMSQISGWATDYSESPHACFLAGAIAN